MKRAWVRTPRVQLPSSVTICGSGNAGHALAVIASQSVDVDWLISSEARADLLRSNLRRGGLRSTGVIAATADRLRTITADPAVAIPKAGLVLIVVPAFAHAAVLRRIGPYLTADSKVGCLPSRGGFEFDAVAFVGENSGSRPTIFGLNTLPWSTRVASYGETVHIGAVKQAVELAALPADRATTIAAQLEAILIGTKVVPADSFLALTLANPGQFIHPGLMYGHFRSWNGDQYAEDRIPLLYAQATKEIGEVVKRLSDDAIAVAEAIDAQSAGRLKVREAVTPVHEWLRTVYGPVTEDLSTVGSCLRTGPIQARKAPMIEVAPGCYRPDFQYRYMSEDVPYGLVATRALAQIADVRTPMIDEVLTWAQSALGRVYLADGGLMGADVAELPLPQNHGVRTVAELVEWYTAGAQGAAPSQQRNPASA